MQNKLQELTGRIYNEGVQKAKDEAHVILTSANEQAATIIAQAQKEADKLLQAATKEAEDMKRNMEGEVKMASLQAFSSLKQQIGDMVTLQITKPSIKEVFENKEFVQSLLLKVVESWTSSGNTNIDLILPESDKQTMEAYFKNSMVNLLNKGIEIQYSKQMKSGFKAGPKGENYVVSFTDEDFINFLKAYLRPKTNVMLFEK